MRRAALLTAALVLACACGGKARATCEKAGERYEGCIREILGDEAARYAAGKRDIDGCAKDEPTVAMYEICLPKGNCDEFMDCIEAYAASH